MKTKTRTVHVVAVAALLAAATAPIGCKSGPSEAPSDFVTSDTTAALAEDERLPFHRVWFDPTWNDAAMRTLVVAPVDTSYVTKADWWDKTTLKGGRLDEDLANLAVYTQEEFKKAFREDKERRFEVVDTPRDDSYVLELALVEVVPNKASLGALGLAATAVAAPLGAGIAAKETAKGKVAIEGRWRRASDQEIVAMFTDREHGKFGPINLRRATWYGHAHKIVQEWADQWVEVVNAEPGEEIDDTRTWTLSPW